MSRLETFLKKAEKVAEHSKLDLFHFISRGKVEHTLRVLRFNGEERVNTAYEFDVELLAPSDVDPLSTLEEQLLGHPATLVMMDSGDVPRVVHGIVHGYEVVGSLDRTSVRVRIKLGARLNLLKLRTHSRIFQDVTVPKVAEQLMREWGVPCSFELVGKYTPRTYLTQYDETDFDFLRRILAREGIYFYFRQSPDTEIEQVIFGDDALYKRAPGLRDRLSMRSGRFEVGEGDIVELGVRRRLRTTGATIADYDFRHPQLPLRSKDLADDGKGVAGELGAERIGHYAFAHFAEHESGASADKREEQAARLLQSARADGMTVVGTSRSRKLLPAHSFALEGHTLDNLNREWVAVAVMHDGKTPEYDSEVTDVYFNEFEAAPIETALRMPPDVRSRKIHGTQTATVVGGDEGDVFTDEKGRIKVQFHWDLEGKRDEHASTWIRVSQPWAGPGFGAQFLPRIGTEVVVTFLDGDPDRPLVIGSVYNGTHPPPFGLPAEKTKSGFRSMSTPGGDGANELSFDDDRGRETFLMKAQRNMEVDVREDQQTKVGGNSVLRVEGQRTENVTGTQTTTVMGGMTTLVATQMTTQVLGDAIDAVRGNADRRVSGVDALRVEGTAIRDLAASETFILRDSVTRVKGHAATVVGEEGRATSATLHVEGTLAGYASQTTELIAERGIVLRCGESSIRLGPDSIEIFSPTVTLSAKKLEAAADEKVTIVSKDGILMKSMRLHAMGESSSLLLYTDADLGGNRVKLNCQMNEAAVLTSNTPLTQIQLTDEDGSPAGGRRYVIVGSAGERSGVLNDKGEAQLELEDDAQIFFPDVDKPREA